MTVTTDTEALVRRAYHLAEGDALDVQGFTDLFAEDGVLNGIGGVEGQTSLRDEQLGGLILFLGRFLPDVHRELKQITVNGDVVSHRAVDPGHLPRGVRDARRRDPADGGQGRVPDCRLLVPAQRQGRGVRLPHRFYHLVRAARHTSGPRVRSRGVRAQTIKPTDKGARLLSSRALQAGLRRGRMACCLRVTRWTSTGVEAEHLHVVRAPRARSEESAARVATAAATAVRREIVLAVSFMSTTRPQRDAKISEPYGRRGRPRSG